MFIRLIVGCFILLPSEEFATKQLVLIVSISGIGELKNIRKGDYLTAVSVIEKLMKQCKHKRGELESNSTRKRDNAITEESCNKRIYHGRDILHRIDCSEEGGHVVR